MIRFNSSGQCKFGQIELFALTPEPVAIVKVFQYTEATLLQQADQPCCQVLEEYKRINILSSFVHAIKPPEEHSHLEVIPIKDIQGKAVYVQLDNSLQESCKIVCHDLPKICQDYSYRVLARSCKNLAKIMTRFL